MNIVWYICPSSLPPSLYYIPLYIHTAKFLEKDNLPLKSCEIILAIFRIIWFILFIAWISLGFSLTHQMTGVSNTVANGIFCLLSGSIVGPLSSVTSVRPAASPLEAHFIGSISRYMFHLSRHLFDRHGLATTQFRHFQNLLGSIIKTIWRCSSFDGFLPENPIVEWFLQFLINRGISEEMTDPWKIILHPVIVVPKEGGQKTEASDWFSSI